MADTPITSAEKKLKNEEKNEAKRRAKLEKLAAKNAKLAELNAGSSASLNKKEKKKPKNVFVEEFVDKTIPGEKKDMSDPMADAYNPSAVESSWYQWWEKQGMFKPDESATESYTIPLPPPNVTGSLHLGHALTNAIQDCMIRWNRMNGKAALFLPGIDHAGIATQVVVEKRLMRDSGKTRHDIGREEFNKQVWKWKEQYGGQIFNQLKRLGSSNDWDRVCFTMDPIMCKAVNETFVKLHQEGIIYRENRLVNWCTKLRTALSNLEVENMEIEGRTWLSVPDHDPTKKYEFGVIISFAYELEGTGQKIVVATTRLETMLGDTAIAVHPNDKRYADVVGKFVIHPFNGRKIKIIADDYVDPEFGTGAVKITPAHDFNDNAIGKRHGLEMITVIDDEGKMNENAAQFKGLQRFDARIAVLEALKLKGLYVETKDNKMVLPICGRSNNIVEPSLKPQWWVNCQDMAKDACDAVKTGKLEISPALSEREWYRWLEIPQDWCISRQLWWGHRIPAYLVCVDGVALDESDGKNWVSGRDFEEAQKNAFAKFSQYKKEQITLQQDPDVLDTWFSAALWPFATLGWPDKTADMQKFYPTSLLETGWDILFFWVARMVMFGIKLTGEVPFKKVFCHAMVRDAHGRKMSKALGNVIDPIAVIEGITLDELHKTLETGNLDPKEVSKAKAGQKQDFPDGIAKCGADALRFTLLTYTSAGRDINLDVLRIEGYKRFCNKLWNATKFALMKLGDGFVPNKTHMMSGKESSSELWILSKLNKAINDMDVNLKDMNFMNSTSAVHNFWLHELCDVYIEISKGIIDDSNSPSSNSAKQTLYTCLDSGLKLLHPMMPFVTEELYQRLPRRQGDSIPSISLTQYPKINSEWDNAKNEEAFNVVLSIVHASRSLITDYSVKNGNVTVQVSDPTLLKLLQTQTQVIVGLVKGLTSLKFQDKNKHLVPEGCALLTPKEEGCDVYLLVKGHVDFEVEIAKFEKKKEKAQTLMTTLIEKTSGADYLTKVKLEVREVNENKINTYKAEIATLEATIKNFERLKC